MIEAELQASTDNPNVDRPGNISIEAVVEFLLVFNQPGSGVTQSGAKGGCLLPCSLSRAQKITIFQACFMRSSGPSKIRARSAAGV